MFLKSLAVQPSIDEAELDRRRFREDPSLCSRFSSRRIVSLRLWRVSLSWVFDSEIVSGIISIREGMFLSGVLRGEEISPSDNQNDNANDILR